MGRKALSYDYVYSYFQSMGCELLEKEYRDNSTKMRYRCSCGQIKYIDFGTFKHRKIGCSNCARLNRLKYDDVYDYFLSRGCLLLETEFKNIQYPMKYKCKCGTVTYSSLANFRKLKGCGKCSNRDPLGYNYVKKYFKDHGCELLEKEYKNSKTRMKYKCECGDIAYITYDSFREGQRCKNCAIKRRTGSNNHNYNPNLTDEDRKDRRITVENQEWRRKVYERDDYSCQICGQKGYRIVAHHLDGYHWCKEKRLDVNNGITLCCKHHKLFHHMFGLKNNTKEQFMEFQNKLFKEAS